VSNELPMLPPWLSESDVSGDVAQVGYEEPVQNLPQQSLIAEKSARKRFGRKSDDGKPEPDAGGSLKGNRKSKRKGKSEEAPEQQPWGEPQQPWGQPQSEAAQESVPQPWGGRPDGAAPQADPQLRPPDALYSNGEAQPSAEFPQSGGGFPPGPHPGTGPQQLAQGFPEQDQRGQQPPPQGPGQSDPMSQLPPANRPPLPEAPQAYSGPGAPTPPDLGDATEMTVRVSRRPDLPPPPDQAPQRPSLPEPPGPGEGQAATAQPNTGAEQLAETEQSPANQAAPGEEQGAPAWLGGPESPDVDPADSGRHRAFDTPAPTRPGPDADQTVFVGRQGDQNAPAPYPPNRMGPAATGFTGQQPVTPQGEQYPPQGFGQQNQGFGPNNAAPADPRMAPPGPPPGQGPQWQSPPQGGPGHPQYQGQNPYQQPPPFQQGQFRGPQGQQPSLDNVPVRRAKKAPGTGWRRTVHHVTGGAINPGMSAEERRLQELVARIRQPVRGDYRIAVLSLKGGVGKTTTTMGIGSIFSSIRGDRVIAVDANPDFGTLSQRVQLQTRSTVRDLLLDPMINSYGDVRRHTSQGTSRLEVLASERDPAASESFSEDEYRRVARILQRFYNIILTDCGTGLMHSAMGGVLELAHSLVLISSSAIDGARSAAATLDWLSLHGHDHLVRNAVVVINLPRPGSPNVGIQQLREYFLSRCRAVHIIPFDPHLSEGAEIELARLNKNTKRALVELAATVADDFATDHHRFSS